MILRLILIFFLFCNSSFARIIEEIIKVPVSVTNSIYSNNPKFEQEITVTIWRDDSIKNLPICFSVTVERELTRKEQVLVGLAKEKIQNIL